jgi:Fe-S-cluster-containing dehydrogenase component
MPKPEYLHFFIDPNRCIGCQSCVQACTECDTHRGESMIHLEFIDRAHSVQTVPVVCMHCEQPTCAEVCPADAIKRTGDGVVQSARKPRCIACGNCVIACPFGVPEVYEDRQIMMKCDMCYDRTSVGKKPMCATVCPSQALFFRDARADRPASADVQAGQPISIRPSDDLDACFHDDAGRAGDNAAVSRCHERDERTPAPAFDCAYCSQRPVRRGGAVTDGRSPRRAARRSD